MVLGGYSMVLLRPMNTLLHRWYGGSSLVVVDTEADASLSWVRRLMPCWHGYGGWCLIGVDTEADACQGTPSMKGCLRPWVYKRINVCVCVCVCVCVILFSFPRTVHWSHPSPHPAEALLQVTSLSRHRWGGCETQSGPIPIHRAPVDWEEGRLWDLFGCCNISCFPSFKGIMCNISTVTSNERTYVEWNVPTHDNP